MYNALKGSIYGKGYTFGTIADKLDINIATFSKKMNGKTEFTASEIKKLTNVLGLTKDEVFEIFFS